MSEKEIFSYLKEQGCCDACCLRFLGIKNPAAYENLNEYVSKYKDPPSTDLAGAAHTPDPAATDTEPPAAAAEDGPPACKRPRPDSGSVEPPTPVEPPNCTVCLGLLQEHTWPECCRVVAEELDKKRYECPTFTCALFAPLSALLRERRLMLALRNTFPGYWEAAPAALKEVWKARAGAALAAAAARVLDAAGGSPLLVAVHTRYDAEEEELSRLGPRPRDGWSRRAVESARLTGAGAAGAGAVGAGAGAAGAVPAGAARAVRAECEHAPIYIGGRYTKLSRELPQSPWVLAGRRVMESSVQELICDPLADLLGVPEAERARRLKFISAGREDVDVRCRGDGRPFAVEVSDPQRVPSAAVLAEVCARIALDPRVGVRRLVVVGREELAVLKQGEQTKCKTYEALCVKLSHGADETATALNGSAPVAVTQADIDRLNAHCPPAPGPGAGAGAGAAGAGAAGAEAAGAGGLELLQRTPLRVLHRRPLLARARRVLSLWAEAVPGHPALFTVRVRTEAGTYVKEWAHGELGRSAPALPALLGARADILALDVTGVELDWPRQSPGEEGEGGGRGIKC